eukprot:CCRYP_021048-RA/>CCRYP_021048-RA protein AED:0.49 eAED:0.49 QI:0/-1/0/1/-1/1/1/0/65
MLLRYACKGATTSSNFLSIAVVFLLIYAVMCVADEEVKDRLCDDTLIVGHERDRSALEQGVTKMC